MQGALLDDPMNRGRLALLKLWLAIAASVGFCVPYFILQRAPLSEPTRLPLLWLDRVVAFDPGFAWYYQSAYLLIFGIPLSLRTRPQIYGWARGFVTVCGVGFLLLACFPMEAPRPREHPSEGMFGLLVSYDGLVNCFPSLHAALTVYSALLGYVLIGQRPAPARVRRGLIKLGLVVWVVVVLLSTIATKQHYSLDLIAGVILGYAGYRIARSSFLIGSN